MCMSLLKQINKRKKSTWLKGIVIYFKINILYLEHLYTAWLILEEAKFITLAEVSIVLKKLLGGSAKDFTQELALRFSTM